MYDISCLGRVKKLKKKQDRSTDTDDGLFDKSNKKTKIQNFNLFANDDTYLQTLSKNPSSKNPSSIINVYSNKTTTQPTIQSTVSASTSTTESTSTTVPKDPVESNYTQELLKLIKIAQSNSSRIKNIMDKQEKFEDKFDKKINEQNTLISDMLTLLKDHEPEKIKGRDKPKKDSDFYQDVVRKLAYEIFHEHKQVTEEQMKTRIKEKLDADEQCVSILQKSEVKGLTFDKLWDKKFKTALLGAIRSKRGYYVRRVKNGLWSIFDVVDTWTGTEMDSNGDNADESAEYSPTPLYLWTKTNNL
ncbi:unnamed protein product [Rhizophagus irregularis]|nr:unnamed protein product [Rhizophagus irregularis]